jgi:PurA ssDNA and RNA-binding protein
MQPWHQSPPRPPVNEDTLKSEEVPIERKTFVFLLKENPRGRFLRIIEESGSKSNSIIIPSAGLKEFQKLLEEMLKASNELPPKNPPQ